MKNHSAPRTPPRRNGVGLKDLLLVVAAVLSLTGARAQAPEQSVANLASPTLEAPTVDASLFTAQSFD